MLQVDRFNSGLVDVKMHWEIYVCVCTTRSKNSTFTVDHGFHGRYGVVLIDLLLFFLACQATQFSTILCACVFFWRTNFLVFLGLVYIRRSGAISRADSPQLTFDSAIQSTNRNSRRFKSTYYLPVSSKLVKTQLL